MQNERLSNSALCTSLCLHSDFYVCPSVSASVLYAYKLDIFLLILLLQTTLTVAPFPTVPAGGTWGGGIHAELMDPDKRGVSCELGCF